MQEKLLQKGLSFCPTNKTNWFKTELDLIQFARRLKLVVWFDDKSQHDDIVVTDTSESNVDFRLKDFGLFNKSDFSPPVTAHAVETYLNLVKHDVEKLKETNEHEPLLHPNLTREEVVALKELTDNP